MAILPDRTELTTPADGDLYLTTDVSDTSDAATGTDKKITWASIKAALKTYFDTLYQPLSAVLTATTASFTTAMETKLGYITVTQAVDLDALEAEIAALANGMVYKGNWDASAGTFPGAGVAQTGWFYTVSVGGTVNGVVFVAGDRLIAIVDNASTTTYAANWTQLDATDAVTSVDSATGNVDLATILFAKTAKTTPVDADTVPFTDSAASNVLKKVTWANIKATLKTYIDSMTSTFTNKRVNPRTASSTTASTLTPDLSAANVYYRTTQTATLTVEAPIGTPVIGETIAIYIDSAGAQTLNMNATYIPFGAAFPATTTAGKTLMITAQFNGTNWKTLWANAV